MRLLNILVIIIVCIFLFNSRAVRKEVRDLKRTLFRKGADVFKLSSAEERVKRVDPYRYIVVVV